MHPSSSFSQCKHFAKLQYNIKIRILILSQFLREVLKICSQGCWKGRAHIPCPQALSALFLQPWSQETREESDPALLASPGWRPWDSVSLPVKGRGGIRRSPQFLPFLLFDDFTHSSWQSLGTTCSCLLIS